MIFKFRAFIDIIAVFAALANKIQRFTGSMHTPRIPDLFFAAAEKTYLSLKFFASCLFRIILFLRIELSFDKQKRGPGMCKTVPSDGMILTVFEIPVFPLCYTCPQQIGSNEVDV